MALVMSVSCLPAGYSVNCEMPLSLAHTAQPPANFAVPFSEKIKFQKPVHTCVMTNYRTLSVGAVVSTEQQKQTLRYKKLGDSDLVISEVTLGTMTWGVQNSEKEAHEQLNYAFDNGVNVLDTAEIYPVPPSKKSQGNTERYIASWLKHRPRDKVIIATKVAGYSEAQSYLRSPEKATRVNADNIKEAVENSLSRLGVDYIDLLQIHWPDRYVPLFGEFSYDTSRWRESVPFEEQLRALQTVIREGKVRYIGVSNETSYGAMEFVHAAKVLGLPKIVSIQNNYSLIVRCHFELDLAEVCCPQNYNIGLLAYSPLAGGSLTGKYLNSDASEIKNARFNVFPWYMNRYNKSPTREAVDKYVHLARRYDLTPVQLALGFVRDRPFVTSTIIGATTMEQLKENLIVFMNKAPLSSEVYAEIEKLFSRYRDPPL